jgi:hypothetical protein
MTPTPTPIDSDAGGEWVSPCWDEDGSFNVVCIVIITSSILVAFVTVLCTVLIAKLCMKLKTDNEKTEIEMSSLKAKREEKKAAAAAADSSSGVEYSRQEETAVTNVDVIHTLETSFVSSTAV